MENSLKKVTYLHQELPPIFERAVGRLPAPDELRAMVAIQQLGGRDLEFVTYAYLVESLKNELEVQKKIAARRHLILSGNLKKQIAAEQARQWRKIKNWGICFGLCFLALGCLCLL